MSDTNPPLHTEIQRPFRRFLEEYEPLRPELYRYCRYLTKSPWDAEDLVQDVLARAFVTLAGAMTAPANPRAFSRLECEGDRISRMRTYFHTPEAVEEVCGELGLPYRTSGYRFW